VTPFVEPHVRDALGLNFNPTAINVREALLRSANISQPTFTMPQRIEEWFVNVANGVTGFATDAAIPETLDTLVGSLHAWMAPTVLAIIAPGINAPRCAARELPDKCKAEVRQQLPAFAARVLAQWNDGALHHDWLPDGQS
jgi:hypothetical protein